MESLERSARLRNSSSLQSKSHPEEALGGCAILALLKIRLIKPCICSSWKGGMRFFRTLWKKIEHLEPVRNSQGTAAISSEFKFRHNVNTLALPNSPAVRPSYR